MSTKKPFARIAVTLPQEVLAAADRLARRLDRSRSWVVAEAVRRFAASTSPEESPRGMVREVVWSPYATNEAELGRQARLRAELALTPEGRLRRAEELLQLAPARKAGVRRQIIGFDNWEDFGQWKAAGRIRL